MARATLFALLLSALGVVMVFIIRALLLPPSPGGLLPSLAVVIAFLAEASLFIAAWWFSIRKYRCPWSVLGFRGIALGPTLSWVILGLILGFAINALYLRLLALANLKHLLPTPPPLPLHEGSAGLLGTLLLVSLLAPVAEETFFRGFLFGGLRQRYGLGIAILVSSGGFALSHIQPTTLVPVFLLGLLLAMIYFASRSLWPAILVHLGYNTIVLSVLF